MKRNDRIVPYYRVSTQRQGRSGLGLDAQKSAVASWAAGSEVLGEYTEVESGRKSDRDRPQLRMALAAARRNNATLVVAKLDRLSRNVAFMSALMDSGVDFVCCDMPSATRLTIHIMAAVAEDEARRISERTKAALAEAKARGTKLGRPENMTHEAQLRGAEASRQAAKAWRHEAGRDVLPRIRELVAEGRSLRDVAAQLNEEGFLTRRGRGYSHVQVARLLSA